MKISSLTTASVILLLAFPVHASNCDGTSIKIKNRLLSETLAWKSRGYAANTHLRKVTSSNSISPGEVMKFTASSGIGSNGNASGFIELLRENGTFIRFDYKLKTKSKSGSGTCYVKEVSASVSDSSETAPVVAIDKQDGKPPYINFFVDRK